MMLLAAYGQVDTLHSDGYRNRAMRQHYEMIKLEEYEEPLASLS